MMISPYHFYKRMAVVFWALKASFYFVSDFDTKR